MTLIYNTLLGRLTVRWVNQVAGRQGEPHSPLLHESSILTPVIPAQQFSLPADPANWNIDKPEPDDDLHRPDPRRDMLNDSGSMFTLRGIANLGCLVLILLGIVTLLSVFSL